MAKNNLTQSSSFRDVLGCDMVDLYLGSDRVRYHVHQKLLCQNSPVFDKMFNGGFAEATTKSTEMPDDDPETFDSFLLWLYRGAFDMIDKSTANCEGGPMWRRIKLYSFAEKYCIEKLSDAAIDAIITGFTGICPSEDIICLTYQTTSDGATLRSYMSQCFAFQLGVLCRGYTMEEIRRLANIGDLAQDVFCHYSRVGKGNVVNPDHLPRCQFHRHGKAEPCSRRGQISRE